MGVARASEVRRYSPFDPDEVHADMRADPVGTWWAVLAQREVFERHRDCPVCAQLLPPREQVPSRLGKVRLSLQQVSDALHLPPGHRVLRMYVTDDPQLLCVVFEAEGLDAIPPNVEVPALEL